MAKEKSDRQSLRALFLVLCVLLSLALLASCYVYDWSDEASPALSDDATDDDDTIDPGAIDCSDFCGFCAGCQDAAGFNVPECNADGAFDATECFNACDVGELDAVVYTLPDGEFQDWTCDEFNDFFAG